MWIEILGVKIQVLSMSRHPPHGGCGLKLLRVKTVRIIHWSPSTRRVWIEIYDGYDDEPLGKMSPSTRRVWIEILLFIIIYQHISVTLHTEGVD